MARNFDYQAPKMGDRSKYPKKEYTFMGMPKESEGITDYRAVLNKKKQKPLFKSPGGSTPRTEELTIGHLKVGSKKQKPLVRTPPPGTLQELLPSEELISEALEENQQVPPEVVESGDDESGDDEGREEKAKTHVKELEYEGITSQPSEEEEPVVQEETRVTPPIDFSIKRPTKTSKRKQQGKGGKGRKRNVLFHGSLADFMDWEDPTASKKNRK